MPADRIETELWFKTNIGLVTAELQQGFRRLQEQVAKGVPMVWMEDNIRGIRGQIGVLDELKRKADTVYNHTRVKMVELNRMIRDEQAKSMAAIRTALRSQYGPLSRGAGPDGTGPSYNKLLREAFAPKPENEAAQARQVAILERLDQMLKKTGLSATGMAANMEGLRATFKKQEADLVVYNRLLADMGRQGSMSMQRLDANILAVAKAWDAYGKSTTAASLGTTKTLKQATQDTKTAYKMMTQAAQDGSIKTTASYDRMIKKLRQLVEADKAAAMSATTSNAQRAASAKAAEAATRLINLAPAEAAALQRRIAAREFSDWRRSTQTRAWGQLQRADQAFQTLQHGARYGDYGPQGQYETDARKMLNELKRDEGWHRWRMRQIAAQDPNFAKNKTYQEHQRTAQMFQSRITSQGASLDRIAAERAAFLTTMGAAPSRQAFTGQMHAAKIAMAGGGVLSDQQIGQIQTQVHALNQYIEAQEADLVANKAKLGNAEVANRTKSLEALKEIYRREELEISRIVGTNNARRLQQVTQTEKAVTAVSAGELQARRMLREGERIASARAFMAAGGSAAALRGMSNEQLMDLQESMRFAGRAYGAGGYRTGLYNIKTRREEIIPLDEFGGGQLRGGMNVINKEMTRRAMTGPALWQKWGRYVTGLNMGFKGNWAAHGGLNRTLFHQMSHRMTNVSQMMGVSLYGMGAIGAMSAITGGTIRLATSIQASQMAIAGMLRSYGQFVDLQGKALKPADQLNAALTRSKDLFEEIRDTSARSLINTKDLTEAFLAGGPQLMAKGFTTAQTLDITNQIMMLGRLQGLTSTAIMSDLRDFATGVVNVRSQVLRSMGMKAEDLKGAFKQGGAPAAYAYFQERGQGFQAVFARIAQTPIGILNRFSVEMQRLGQTIGETLVPIILPKLIEFREWIEDWVSSGAAQEFAASFGGFIGGIMSTFQQFIDFAKPWLNSLQGVIFAGIVAAFSWFIAKLAIQTAISTPLGLFISALGLFLAHLWLKAREADRMAREATAGAFEPQDQREIDVAASQYKESLITRMRQGIWGEQTDQVKAFQMIQPEIEKASKYINAVQVRVPSARRDFNALWEFNKMAESWTSSSGRYQEMRGEVLAGTLKEEDIKKIAEEGSGWSWNTLVEGQNARNEAIFYMMMKGLIATGYKEGDILQGIKSVRRAYDIAKEHGFSGTDLAAGRGAVSAGLTQLPQKMLRWQRQYAIEWISKNPKAGIDVAYKYGQNPWDALPPEGKQEVMKQVAERTRGEFYNQLTGMPEAEKPPTGTATGSIGPRPTLYEEAQAAFLDMWAKRIGRVAERIPDTATYRGVGGFVKRDVALAAMGAEVQSAVAQWRQDIAEVATGQKGQWGVVEAMAKFYDRINEVTDAFAETVRTIEASNLARQQEIAIAKENLEIARMELAIRKRQAELGRVAIFAPGGRERYMTLVEQQRQDAIRLARSQYGVSMREQVYGPEEQYLLSRLSSQEVLNRLPEGVRNRVKGFLEYGGANMSPQQLQEFIRLIEISEPLSRQTDAIVAAGKAVTEEENARAKDAMRGKIHVTPASRAAFIKAIVAQESGGDYGAKGVWVPRPHLKEGKDRAYGKYQVMGENVGPWTKKYYGKWLTPDEFLRNPKAQDAVAQGRLNDYVTERGFEGAALAWYAGPKGAPSDKPVMIGGKKFPSINDYVKQVMDRFQSLLPPDKKSDIGQALISQALSGVMPPSMQNLAWRSVSVGGGIALPVPTGMAGLKWEDTGTETLLGIARKQLALKVASDIWEANERRREAVLRLEEQTVGRLENGWRMAAEAQSSYYGLTPADAALQKRANDARMATMKAELDYQDTRAKGQELLYQYMTKMDELEQKKAGGPWYMRPVYEAMMKGLKRPDIEGMARIAFESVDEAIQRQRLVDVEKERQMRIRNLRNELRDMPEQQRYAMMLEGYGDYRERLTGGGGFARGIVLDRLGQVAKSRRFDLERIKDQAKLRVKQIELGFENFLVPGTSTTLAQVFREQGVFDRLERQYVSDGVRDAQAGLSRLYTPRAMMNQATVNVLSNAIQTFAAKPFDYIRGMTPFGSELGTILEPVTKQGADRAAFYQSMALAGMFGISPGAAIRAGYGRFVKWGMAPGGRIPVPTGVDRARMLKIGMGQLAGQIGGNLGGSWLGSAVFPNKDLQAISIGAGLGTALGAEFGISALGIAAGPWGALAGGMLGGMIGGLFGGKRADPEEERRKQLERQHQQRMEDLLSRIDKSLRPQADYFRTIKGDVLYGTASRWYSGRAYAQLGLQGALGGR